VRRYTSEAVSLPFCGAAVDYPISRGAEVGELLRIITRPTLNIFLLLHAHE
jgi:hypothetical protein